MCKRHKLTLVISLVLISVMIHPASAQTGGGMSPSIEKGKGSSSGSSGGGKGGAKKGTPKAAVPVKPKAPKKAPTPKTAAGAKRFGSLIIAASEPEAEVFVTDSQGVALLDGEPVFTDANGSYTFYDLPPGAYAIVVRKPGYSEIKQSVTVKAGPATRVNAKLVSTLGFLSVRTDPDGAEIDIEGVGTTGGNLTRRPLAPGTYRVTVRMRGYETQTRDITVATPGADANATIVLKRIDTNALIRQAVSELELKNYDRAAELALTVVDIEPENPEALLVSGVSLYEKGSTRAADHLAKSVMLGQRASIRVNYLSSDNRMVVGTLSLNAVQLEFTAASDATQSFTLSKGALQFLSLAVDRQSVPYISFKADGMFGVKRANRTVKLYSPIVHFRAGSRDAFCQPTSGGPARCSTDAENINQLLLQWQRQYLAQMRSHLVAGEFNLSVPDNWQHRAQSTNAIFFPQGSTYGEGGITHGILAGVFNGQGDLLQSTRAYLAEIIKGNPYLRETGNPTNVTVGGQPGYRTLLAGTLPATGRTEMVTIYTSMSRGGHIAYIATVVPENERQAYAGVFEKVLNSIKFSY